MKKKTKKRMTILDKAEVAMKEAVKKVVAEHKRLGLPLAVWENGRVKKFLLNSSVKFKITEPIMSCFRKARMIIACCLLCLCLTQGAALAAFPFDLHPASKSAVEKMSDQELLDAYVEAVVELQAVDVFYKNAGITPKEFFNYKKLLRYRADLIIEMEKRELKIPQI